MLTFKSKNGIIIAIKDGKKVAVYGTIFQLYTQGLIGCNDAKALVLDDYMVIELESMGYKIFTSKVDALMYIESKYIDC